MLQLLGSAITGQVLLPLQLITLGNLHNTFRLRRRNGFYQNQPRVLYFFFSPSCIGRSLAAQSRMWLDVVVEYLITPENWESLQSSALFWFSPFSLISPFILSIPIVVNPAVHADNPDVICSWVQLRNECPFNDDIYCKELGHYFPEGPNSSASTTYLPKEFRLFFQWLKLRRKEILPVALMMLGILANLRTFITDQKEQ